MDPVTRRQLNAINRRFYAQAHGQDFHRSRDRAWPGFARLLQWAPAHRPLRVLDVGCGNGRFLSALRQGALAPLSYQGLDGSATLLERAREKHGTAPDARFALTDLVEGDPQQALAEGPWDLIVLMGVMHHVPGVDGRRALLSVLSEHLASDGLLAFTVWRLDQDPRFERRRVPWQQYNAHCDEPIATERLEPGDTLIAWGDDRRQPRYCHFPAPEEVAGWVTGLALQPLERFQADGASASMNEYHLLRADGQRWK